jgi:GrpB-like predicted nucleotidyltransferase (UPF0157 family)
MEKADIVVVESDPGWLRKFATQREKILGALSIKALAIDHIGSTSVPGLAAKPIIDVCLTVADTTNEGSYLPDLQSVGYQLRVREPAFYEHRMLRTMTRDVNVHVFSLGYPEIARYLVFRDWLRQNRDDRYLYESTKRRLASKHWPTTQHYADAKTGVIMEIMGRALATDTPR